MSTKFQEIKIVKEQFSREYQIEFVYNQKSQGSALKKMKSNDQITYSISDGSIVFSPKNKRQFLRCLKQTERLKFSGQYKIILFYEFEENNKAYFKSRETDFRSLLGIMIDTLIKDYKNFSIEVKKLQRVHFIKKYLQTFSPFN